MHEDGATLEDDKKHRWATTISNFTIPPTIAVITFALINYTVSSGLSFVVLTLLTTLFAMAVPLGVIIVLRRNTDARDIDLPLREERRRPLLLSAASYFVGAAVLLVAQSPALITGVAFAYGVGTLVIFLINLRWKISIHTMGIAGPTTVLVFVFGAWGALLGLLIPPVAWSRLYLEKHTVAQVIGGVAAGVVLTTVAMWLLFSSSTNAPYSLR